MTLFGDVVTPHGGQVWLGSLIALLAPFGISDRLVRTSVFRLAEEGWLDAQRNGRRSQYQLDPAAARRFGRAHQRIYSPSYRAWDGSWTLVLATSPAITTEQRGRLRKELLWEGFGLIAPSVYAHPGADAATLEEIVTRVGVEGSVFICHGTDAALAAARPMKELIGQCWNLDDVMTGYAQFIDSFDGLPRMLENSPELDAEQAFVIRTLLIHAFRRVQLHDPQLPLELLPAKWPGKTAYELCHAIYQATHAGAETHVVAILQAEDPTAALADPGFYQRFGGLR